jgi:hypothetical protein
MTSLVQNPASMFFCCFFVPRNVPLAACGQQQTWQTQLELAFQISLRIPVEMDLGSIVEREVP